MFNNIKSQIYKIFPKWRANRLYKSNFHRYIDWKNPTELNEKIRWMQFNTDTTKWSLLADKYKVREYLKSKGYEGSLVKLYGYWEKAEDINFDSLPEKFVLKTNHGCGGIYIVKDKANENLEDIRIRLAEDLKKKYGHDAVETHYFKIKPVVIAEQLLEQDGTYSTSLVDFKFFCTSGHPQYCLVVFNRDNSVPKHDVKLYDMDWNDCSNLLRRGLNKTVVQFPKPSSLNEMIHFCEDMCSEFPFVRMDFYEVGGKMYFGEFTFTPAGCSGGSLSHDLCEKLGHQIILPNR